LFRVTTTGQTEGTVPANEKILFNPSPSGVSTGESYVFTSEVFYRNSIPENPKVSGQINQVQDMGLDGIDIMLKTKFLNSSNDATDSKMDILRKWLIEDKTNTDFPKGRFGLRMDDLPIFNVTPVGPPGTPQLGYVLANVRFMRLEDDKNKVDVDITLRFSGDPAGL